MSSSSDLLKKLFEVGSLQKLQDKVSFATDVAMITVDVTGRPVSAHSGCSQFCKRVRQDPHLKQQCEKCDSRGGLEAARLSRPYIYLCHMGIVDFAIPIFLQNNYVGSVMAGQIRLSDEYPLERVTDAKNEASLKGAFLSLYRSLPSMSIKRIKALSDMIFYLYNYVIKEASDKLVNCALDEDQNFSLPSDKKLSVIKNAIDYINENFTKTIRLDHLASLCDISPSYFSKLFKKIMNVNLSAYVNGLRINKAKMLLSKSDKPIIDIAYESGFEDCGYFIKNFKKLTGVTPSEYRNLR